MNMTTSTTLAAGTGTSFVIRGCQICDNTNLKSAMFLGYLPPVNTMPKIGERPKEEPSYPAELLFCPTCELAQLSLVVDPKILFPPEYPYTSGTTKILRENFAELYQETNTLFPLKADDLVMDIGSNDGTLLSNFKNGGHRVLGIEPTLMAKLATERGIPSIMEFFSKKTAEKAVAQAGRAKVVTATNVFAHIENIHDIVSGIVSMLTDDGLFISESHYFNSLVETLQYDTIYHEHLRYYSLKSLSYLFKMHGLEVIHAKKIPTHGGSIRVVAAPKGTRRPLGSVQQIMDEENKANLGPESLLAFRDKVVQTKLDLYSLLSGIKQKGGKIYGVGAPSRASTLINYVGLDDGILDAVLEIKGSYKIGKYMPGTVIPVLDENMLFEKQPEYALLLSWHIADELMPKLKARGYKGKFIVPLPEPRVVSLDS